MQIVLASANAGKRKEIEALLVPLGHEVIPVGDLTPEFDPVEDGETFLENARIKALEAFRCTGLPTVADDSGLCVVGLGLEPGVRSARYAGPGASDSDRVARLLHEMRDLRGDDRQAWFACAVVAVLREDAPVSPGTVLVAKDPDLPPGWVLVSTEGRAYGRIGFEAKGDRGFGYDPVFLPDETPGETLAQLEMGVKNGISHRGKAFSQFAACLTDQA